MRLAQSYLMDQTRSVPHLKLLRTRPQHGVAASPRKILRHRRTHRGHFRCDAASYKSVMQRCAAIHAAIIHDEMGAPLVRVLPYNVVCDEIFVLRHRFALQYDVSVPIRRRIAVLCPGPYNCFRFYIRYQLSTKQLIAKRCMS